MVESPEVLARSTFASILATAIVLSLSGSAMAAPTDLDTAFSGDGKMVDPTLSQEQSIYATEIQNDGKIVTVGSDVASQQWLVMRFNTDGSLDDTFDGPSGTGNGKVLFNPSTSFDAAYDVAITLTGKIIVAGRIRNTTSGLTEFGAVRLEPNGTIDPGFNSGQIKQFPLNEFPTSEAYVESVGVEAGKIVIGGCVYSPSTCGDYAFARLENDGDLDATFDTDGTLALNLGVTSTIDYVTDIHVQADQKIVAAGTSSSPISVNTRVFTVIRLDTDGSLDATFGDTVNTPGKYFATTVPGRSAGMTVKTGGKFLITGNTDNDPSDCLVVQLTPSGLPDPSFSSDGYQTVDFRGAIDECNDVAADASGNVLISGMARDDEFQGDAAIARLTPAGELDTTFDPDGKLILDLTQDNDRFQNINVLSGGEILASGYEGMVVHPTASILVQLEGGASVFVPPTRPPNLALDSTFGGDGRVTSEFVVGRKDNVYALAPGANGSVFAAGSLERSFSNSYLPYGAIVKYASDGSVDSSFGGDGIASLELPLTPSVQTVEFVDLVVLPDGSILALGEYSANGAGTDIVLAKFTPTGELDTSFDSDGWIASSIVYSDEPGQLHRMSDGSLIVTGTVIDTDEAMFVAKYDEAGQPVSGFGANGITQLEFTNFEPEEAHSSVLLEDDSVVLAGYSIVAGNRAVALAKVDSGGVPDASFDVDGKVELPLGTGDSEATGIAAQSGGELVITGYGYDGGLTKDMFVARLNADGTLDEDDVGHTGFSDDGVLFVPFAADSATGGDVVVNESEGEITAGGTVNYGVDDDFAFARTDLDGNLLSSFDDDGFGSTEVGSYMDSVRTMTLDSKRRVVAAGRVFATSLADFGLVRFTGPFIPEDPSAVPPASGGPPTTPTTYGASSKLSSPKNKGKYSAKKLKTVKGSASTINPGDPITKVEVAIRKVEKDRCKWLSSAKIKFRISKPKAKLCDKMRFLKASGTTTWSLKLSKLLPKGKYVVYSRVTTASGQTETAFSSKSNKASFTVR